jgi:hypothetical protein
MKKHINTGEISLNILAYAGGDLLEAKYIGRNLLEVCLNGQEVFWRCGLTGKGTGARIPSLRNHY